MSVKIACAIAQIAIPASIFVGTHGIKFQTSTRMDVRLTLGFLANLKLILLPGLFAILEVLYLDTGEMTMVTHEHKITYHC